MVSLVNIKSRSIVNNIVGNKIDVPTVNTITTLQSAENKKLTTQINTYMNTIISESIDNQSDFLTDNLSNLVNLINTNDIFKKSIESIGLTVQFFENTLTLIKKSVTLVNINQDFENLKLEFSGLQQEYNSINSLLEQINYLQRQFNVFDDVETTMSVKPQINDQYLTYINTYGYPEDGIFNLSLLKQ